MIYSAFDERERAYAVYEDSRRHPMNGDLPVPTFGPEVGGIGFPAREAGRDIPPDAEHIGWSVLPKGMIAKPISDGSSDLSGIEDGDDGYAMWLVLAAIGIGGWLYWTSR